MHIQRSSNYFWWIIVLVIIFFFQIIISDKLNHILVTSSFFKTIKNELIYKTLVINVKITHKYPSGLLNQLLEVKKYKIIDPSISQYVEKSNYIECSTECTKFLTNQKYDANISVSQKARWIYDLSISHYRDSNIDSAIQLLKLSKNLTPEWSYFHLELANIYFQTGQKEEAEQILKICMKTKIAKIGCQHFHDNYPESMFPVGSYQDIAKHDMTNY